MKLSCYKKCGCMTMRGGHRHGIYKACYPSSAGLPHIHQAFHPNLLIAIGKAGKKRVRTLYYEQIGWEDGKFCISLIKGSFSDKVA